MTGTRMLLMMLFPLHLLHVAAGQPCCRELLDQARLTAYCAFWLARADAGEMQVLKPEMAKTHGSMSLGEYVQQQGYSQAFISNYLLPMCAAVWSVPNSQVTHILTTLHFGHSAP